MKIGRPCKLTTDVQDRIITALSGGNTREAAAGYAGVTYRSLYNWLTRGRKAKRGRFFQFFHALKRAENEVVIRNVALISKAAQRTWTAAAWWLERRRPADWGRKDTTKLVGPGRGGAVIVVTLGPGQSMEDL